MSDNAPLTFEDLARAFERVAENSGCAGVDGESIERFAADRDEKLGLLLRRSVEGTYQPLPLLRIVLQKKPGSTATRSLLVPAVRDRILQTAVAQQLSRSFEDEFLESSFAYRPGRGVDRAIARIRQLRDEGYWEVVDCDIRGYFDRIDHHLLMREAGPRTPRPWDDWIYRWISSPYWDGVRLRGRKAGIPQGSPISPMLANLFLQPLDVAILNADGRLVRYADDFIVLAKTPVHARALMDLVASALRERGLELNVEKSSLTSFDAGFHFLGVYFHKGEIWRPWKEAPAAQGRLLHMAAPMPPWRLVEYDNPPGETELESALNDAGLKPWRLSPARVDRAEEGEVAYLYLTEQGSVLRKSGDRMLVELEDRIVLDIPYHKLEHVLLFGHVQVTTQALMELLEKGVDLSLFSRRGQYRGSLTPPRSGNARDRMEQYALWKDDMRSLDWAKRIVAAKLSNSATVIRYWGRSATPTPPEAAMWIEEIDQLREDSAEAAHRDQLLGYEGQAAKLHFRAIGRFNRSDTAFDGRMKRPAPDPFNALLSLAYTLLTQEIGSLVEAEGLDPCLAVLHEIDRSRPSLALDLVEVFRAPAADRLVLRLFNLDMVTARHFVPATERAGAMLTPAGLRSFLAEYERWMLRPSIEGALSFRALLRQEVRNYLKALRSSQPFDPYRFSVTVPEGPGEGQVPFSITGAESAD